MRAPKLYAATIPPKGDAPNDTLTAAQSIARAPWYQPTRVFALVDQFHPIPKGKNLRPVPYMPYLNTAPSAWGSAAQVRWRRLSRGRQSHVRQRGEPLGRRQLHGRLAGVGQSMARSSPPASHLNWPPDFTNHYGLYPGGGIGGRYLRCSRRCQG